jgi:hypothetical protein
MYEIAKLIVNDRQYQYVHIPKRIWESETKKHKKTSTLYVVKGAKYYRRILKNTSNIWTGGNGNTNTCNIEACTEQLTDIDSLKNLQFSIKKKLKQLQTDDSAIDVITAATAPDLGMVNLNDTNSECSEKIFKEYLEDYEEWVKDMNNGGQVVKTVQDYLTSHTTMSSNKTGKNVGSLINKHMFRKHPLTTKLKYQTLRDNCTLY